MRSFRIKYIILSFLIITLTAVLDQITKHLALYNLEISQPITFFFSLTLSFNKGVSFGILNHPEMSQMILVIISCCILIGLLWTMNRHNLISYSLISGGAIGNIIDRLKIGAVVDFLHLHYDHYHFPIFNVADIAISLGCGIFLLREVIESHKNQPDSKSR
jgi:signal peptidase II